MSIVHLEPHARMPNAHIHAHASMRCLCYVDLLLCYVIQQNVVWRI